MSKTQKDIQKVIKKLEQFGKEADDMIEDTTFATALEIVASAKAKAPKNKGKLAQSIYHKKESDKNYSINVGLEYGAYVEFGTGKHVSIPSELKDVASKFKNRKGSFEEGLRSIKDWCRSKGIEEKLAYPIFMSILRNGLTPQPFLYPALVKGREQYLKDLKGDLKELKRKYG